ncbi:MULTISPECIES: hypothetical protein [unclassified Crossiella]|uniref:DUF7711 family protein n=1 Tax=unclassified Crossiella TaxID=2620835 RepID=UPI001FFEF388|nr:MULTISPECIES: hypothetical protein [unclassified Crossiella]MCK2240616.1 hypothetical protein [Crossiella sp. S99.2]MCK2252933.1 hypothetical protein [Crossiella sp. S99.1]
MKRNRAAHHLETLAQTCAGLIENPNPISPLRVRALWAAGEILDPAAEPELITVALVVDLPPAEVPWRGEPTGAQHWANLTRLSRNPFLPLWRSAHAPVWNHHIVRPALIWSAETGIAEDTLAALAEGDPESVRAEAPSTVDYQARVAEELEISHAALTAASETYEARRWSPGKLEPYADTLFRAGKGYLELLAASQN